MQLLPSADSSRRRALTSEPRLSAAVSRSQPPQAIIEIWRSGSDGTLPIIERCITTDFYQNVEGALTTDDPPLYLTAAFLRTPPVDHRRWLTLQVLDGLVHVLLQLATDEPDHMQFLLSQKALKRLERTRIWHQAKKQTGAREQ